MLRPITPAPPPDEALRSRSIDRHNAEYDEQERVEREREAEEWERRYLERL